MLRFRQAPTIQSSLRRITLIGSRILTMTRIGSSGPSRSIFSDIQVPALHIGGWYDIFLTGTLRNYMGIKAHGGTEEARKGQRLLVQIGGHAGFGRRIGDGRIRR